MRTSSILWLNFSMLAGSMRARSMPLASSMLLAGSILFAGSSAFADATSADDAQAAQRNLPIVGVERQAIADGVRIDARLPGRLLSVATPRKGPSDRDILLLVAMGPADRRDTAEDRALRSNNGSNNGSKSKSKNKSKSGSNGSKSNTQPKPDIDGPGSVCDDPTKPERVELWQLNLHGGDAEPSLDLVRSDLPIDATAIEATDLDGDGIDELLMARPGELLRLPLTGPWVSLLKDPGIAGSGLDARIVSLDAAGLPWVRVNDIGRARLYRGGPVGFERVGEVKTRTSVGSFRQSILIYSPELFDAGHDADGRPRFATAPTVIDNRVRVDRIEMSSGTAETATEAESLSTVECWGQLPGRERPIERFIEELNGEPVAVLTTMEAGKLNLFGEKRLRIVPLRADRSKAGHDPILAVTSRINLWQSATPYFLDADGDGVTDLVLAYWKGLKDDRVVLDAYPGNGSGSFGLQPKSTSFDVQDGDRGWLIYGDDLTGDGVADLLLRGSDNLLLFPGLPSLKGLVQKKSVQTVPFGAAACDEAPDPATEVSVSVGGGGGSSSVTTVGGPAPPRIVDVDGDGIGEIMLAWPEDCGAGRLQLFSFNSAR